MEYEKESKLERLYYLRKAFFAIFVFGGLAALGAWLIQPAAASMNPPLFSSQPATSNVVSY